MFYKQKKWVGLLLTFIMLFGLSATAFAASTVYSQQNPQTYTVAFQIIGSGTASTGSNAIEFSAGDVVDIVATPRAGYQFYGWTSNSSSVVFSNTYSYATSFIMPANDVVITANFVASNAGGSDSYYPGTTGGGASQYYVLFNSAGGSSVPTAYVNANTLLAQPTSPTKEGYFFAGWYADSGYTIKYDFSEPVTYNFTLYALWSETSNFTDVPASAWYADSVFSLTKKGIMNGVSGTRFAPQETLTRAMVAQILANLSGAVVSHYSYVPFSDVPSDAWYFKAVAWAVDTGVIQGTSATSFNPNAPVTRQDLAVMIYRYASNVSGTILPRKVAAVTFADDAQIASHAKSAVQAMQQAAIISGKANNRFDPRGRATRAEVAKMMNQYIQYEN